MTAPAAVASTRVIGRLVVGETTEQVPVWTTARGAAATSMGPPALPPVGEPAALCTTACTSNVLGTMMTATLAAAMASAQPSTPPSPSSASSSSSLTASPLAPSPTHMLLPSLAMIKINCGLLGGVSQAGLFNPWDRALYLSVKHKRPFLSMLNFQQPYQGFMQAIVQRTLSTGLYFPLEDLFMGPCRDLFGPNTLIAPLLAGNLAGAINGVALNPAAAVKYQTWGLEHSSFLRTAQLMWRDGGIAPFLKGTTPTILRDFTFGGIYSLLRNHLLLSLKERDEPGQKRTKSEIFVVNVVAAGVATTVSGPFNYVRNIKFSVPADMQPPNTRAILQDLWHEALRKKDWASRCKLIQERLRIGWGTARVAVGMAFTNHIYESCKDFQERT